jgi:hypothetical protein
MNMMAKQITQEELNRLYSMSIIPAIIIFAFVLVYYSFVHLEQISSSGSLMLDLLVNLFPLILLLPPLAFFLTFEILYSQRVKDTAKLCIRRFLGRMVILLVSVALFLFIYMTSYFFFAPLISEKFAILLSFWLWLIVLGLFVARLGHVFSKLEKGEW